jgi:hypothetical protein
MLTAFFILKMIKRVRKKEKKRKKKEAPMPG